MNWKAHISRLHILILVRCSSSLRSLNTQQKYTKKLHCGKTLIPSLMFAKTTDIKVFMMVKMVSPILLPWGVLKFGFSRDVLLQNLKVDPHKYQFFKKKWSIHKPICSILGQILSKITWFFQFFCKIWANFIPLPRGWFCYPCWQHILIGSFELSTTPHYYCRHFHTPSLSM